MKTSLLQQARAQYQPKLPKGLQGAVKVVEGAATQSVGDQEEIKGRYADTLEPGFEKAKAEIGEKAHSDEDVLSYIAFPTQAEAFFDKRDEQKKNTFTYAIQKMD